MKQKKLDNLFQEQLKNLEISPNNKVWNNIEAKLLKKKRSVLPFWWFSGSVAAILVLALFLYPFLSDENQKIKINSDEIITIIPEKKSNIQNTIDTLIINNKKIDEVLITKKTTPLNNQKKEAVIFIDEKKNNIIQSKKAVREMYLISHQIDENLASNKLVNTIITPKLADEIVTKKMDLNDFLSTEKSSEIKKTKAKNWAVTPVFAVLKSNSFTNTSPINENLANSTKGENSYSYGVQISYSLNKKWAIQSGVHLQEMSYSNNQIGIYNSTSGSTSTTEFINGDSFSFDNGSPENLSLSSDFQTNIISANGSLNQNFGYIEIPVEIKYNFYSSSKINTQFVTGFSSLFLNKNEVNLNTASLSKKLEAANLNNINFSGNLGFDFNYFFNKNWSLNLNPMFKVQLNTFNDNANGFSPFNIGVYSGIKYQF